MQVRHKAKLETKCGTQMTTYQKHMTKVQGEQSITVVEHQDPTEKLSQELPYQYVM
jgi:hypothetical protein